MGLLAALRSSAYAVGTLPSMVLDSGILAGMTGFRANWELPLLCRPSAKAHLSRLFYSLYRFLAC